MDNIDFDKAQAILIPRVVSFPWSFGSEDRWAAQEAVKILYASLVLPAPRFAWATSPATMYRASRMLRTIQAGTAHKMVQALVPVDGMDRIEREARVALLSAMIDPDVTTQSGGLIINLISGVFGGESKAVESCLNDLRGKLNFTDSDPSGTSAPPTFRSQSLWPSFYPGFSVARLAALQAQAIIIMPFTKVCWLCRPPEFIRTDGYGRLHCADGPAAKWSDGFEVWCDRTPEGEKRLKSGDVLALPAETEAAE